MKYYLIAVDQDIDSSSYLIESFDSLVEVENKIKDLNKKSLFNYEYTIIYGKIINRDIIEYGI